MDKKIAIATLYTGFNFGSSLQAYAVKTLMEDLGYTAEIWKVKGSIIKGRDIRLQKLFVMLIRAIFIKNGYKQLKNYKKGYAKKISEGSKAKFNYFANNFLAVRELAYSKMRKLAKQECYKAFVCGSDQIWNATALYIDPFYYLRFAPQEKRVAFAPSFGKAQVLSANQKKIKKYISQIPYKSVRERSGAYIVQNLTGESIPVLVDPTLLLDEKKWCDKLKIKDVERSSYLLAYFLDKPNKKAIKIMEQLKAEYGLKIINLPYEFSDEQSFNSLSAGPDDFLSLIKNASFVCTDSFHGTAFSLNFNIPFYTFERNYGMAEKQSTRIHSLLSKTNMLNRFEPNTINDCFKISFDFVNEILCIEREKAIMYIEETLKQIENKR